MAEHSFIEFDSDLVDVDDSLGYFVLLTFTTILIVLSTGARITTKLCYRLRHGIEDYMIIVALVGHSHIQFPLFYFLHFPLSYLSQVLEQSHANFSLSGFQPGRQYPRIPKPRRRLRTAFTIP